MNRNRKKKKILICTLLAIGVFLAAIRDIKADFVFSTPENLGLPVNSSNDEACPRISVDGLTLYFASDRPGGSGWDLWVTTRESINDLWSEPLNFGTPVNTSYEEAFPELSSDGLVLIFASNRPGGYGWLDMYVTTRTSKNDPWSEPVNLGPVINDENAQDGQSLSKDGLTMYFVSCTDWPGQVGGCDMYMTTRTTVSGSWGMPVNLGPILNSTSHDYTTDLSDCELLLFFQSLRPGGLGETDLYVTRRRTASEPFGQPVNLGPPVNTSAFEGTPNISADGHILYFHSDRPGTLGKWDLWQASVEPVVDLNSDGIVDAEDMCIILDNWDTDEPLCDIGPTPFGDGVVDVQDLIVLAEHLFEETTPTE